MIRTINPEHASLIRNPKFKAAIENPLAVIRELTKRSLYEFLKYFWPVVSTYDFQDNWHLKYLSEELEKIADSVSKKIPREYDLIINVPPGSTKTILTSIMFPVWCWTKWPQFRFITASYSGALSLESAETSRDLIRSPEFQMVFPDIDIKSDKDTKSNFKVVKKHYETLKTGYAPYQSAGGYRFSTSVGGTLMGFHGDIIIVDDPLNPEQAVSDVEILNASRWMEKTLPTRKTNKAVSTTILIMQRLHQNDPTGAWLDKKKKNVKHICIPGEILNFQKYVNPRELTKYYKDDMFDTVRLPWAVLDDLKIDLGEDGYAGQIGQNPVPPGGAMFKVENFEIVEDFPRAIHVVKSVRYWDKAVSSEKRASYTAGVKISQLINGRYIVEDVIRGKWSVEKRERIIQETAQKDGLGVMVWMEQEPGSGGKESVQSSIQGLAGFVAYAERTTGDKIMRAESYSVQVNNGGVKLLKAPWNYDFIEEHRFFPHSTFKDQVDAAAGAFNKLIFKKIARVIY